MGLWKEKGEKEPDMENFHLCGSSSHYIVNLIGSSCRKVTKIYLV
jgi:hypothetical protein